MFEFSIPDFNETNIISLFISSSNTERREVVFCTIWFIGQYQYCSERGDRVPLSLYIPRTRREGTIVAVLYFHFKTRHSTDAKVNFPGKGTLFLTFSINHRRESKVHSLSLLLLHSVLHFIIFSMPNRPRKQPFSMSASGKNIYEVNINESALLGVSPLLGSVLDVLLLLGVVFVPDMLATNFSCFWIYIWTEQQWNCIFGRLTY